MKHEIETTVAVRIPIRYRPPGRWVEVMIEIAPRYLLLVLHLAESSDDDEMVAADRQ